MSREGSSVLLIEVFGDLVAQCLNPFIYNCVYRQVFSTTALGILTLYPSRGKQHKKKENTFGSLGAATLNHGPFLHQTLS